MPCAPGSESIQVGTLPPSVASRATHPRHKACAYALLALATWRQVIHLVNGSAQSPQRMAKCSACAPTHHTMAFWRTHLNAWTSAARLHNASVAFSVRARQRSLRCIVPQFATQRVRHTISGASGGRSDERHDPPLCLCRPQGNCTEMGRWFLGQRQRRPKARGLSARAR